ncbi:SPOR domain-containing protein [Pseudophaeobacter sp. EL27]|uniref:SPOR domain-containing protein n=1 Tax=Pseudophaeobacter sp. EL27 TaxID=2107580 RepID=UPI000EFC6D0C|nr:SPOR domain-containing protein [Pseudophaeobacter sp. EL27]
MKLTRIVALAIIASSAAVSVQTSALQAQSLRSVSPPAQFPPASYKGKQFVDSRGCVYIRAGIDGNVNWVPRVARNRKQLCGYKPTAVAGTTARPTQSAPPEQITLNGSAAAPAAAAPAARARPAASTATPESPRRAAAAAASPTVVTTTRVRRTPQTTTARVTPAPKPAPRTAAAPVRIQPVPAAPAPQLRAATNAPTGAAQGGCSGASAISQQYSNHSGVRCGPQTKSPVSYGSGTGRQSSLRLTPNTRVLPVHVYQQQRHSQDLATPAGYKPVWTDDRLNPRRAERDLRSAILTSQTEVPAGYVLVERGDDRMNPMRGVRTERGDAQMAEIWSNGTPRRLRDLPLDRQIVTARNTRQDQFQGTAQANGLALRLSSRSAPGATLETTAAPTQSRYIRAATFADQAEAQQAARGLAATGVPVRLGSVSRNGKPYKVVLAGPFGTQDAAAQALGKVQAAGYRGARISR